MLSVAVLDTYRDVTGQLADEGGVSTDALAVRRQVRRQRSASRYRIRCCILSSGAHRHVSSRRQ